ncbi:MAG: ABC transporter ATP-binding protein [Syntrophaceae bacterium]|jgi:ABC-2 type transport system ATP-binding protein|nr:ABC transporter ATP-binding protein [Syntrophaceae bacterium]
MQDSPLPMVEVKNVFLRFKQVEALRDVSFDVERQTIFGLVGSDGAGKSSMLRLIAGMLKPSLGTIRINGLDVTEQHGKIKQLIGYMPQRFGLYPDLTVDENMAFFMDVFGIARAERKKRREKYLGFSNLLPFANRPAGNLSGGMKQKLGLACVLVHEPRLLILDEPTNGVDPVSRHEFWDILNNMKQEGMTMIISTAYLDEGEMCDSLGVMHQSVLLASAPPDVISGGQNSLEEAIILQIEQKNGDLAHDTFQL